MPLTGRGCLQGGNVGRCFPSPLALVPADQTKQTSWPFSPCCLGILYLPLRVCVRVCTCPNGRRRTQDGLSTDRCPSTKTSDPETGLIWQPRPAALSRFIQTSQQGTPYHTPSDLLAGRSFSLLLTALQLHCTVMCTRRTHDGPQHTPLQSNSIPGAPRPRQ